MSTDRLNRIIEEVKLLTPDDRRRLLERLEREEFSSVKALVRRAGTLRGTVKYMAPDFDAPLDEFREYME